MAKFTQGETPFDRKRDNAETMYDALKIWVKYLEAGYPDNMGWKRMAVEQTFAVLAAIDGKG